MNKLDKLNEWLLDMAEKEAEEVIRLYSANIHERLYLYFKVGSIKAGINQPLDYDLATPESIPRNRDKDGLKHWIRSNLDRLPIVPAELPTPTEEL